MPVAELNIARPLYPLDDPRIAGFMDNLDRINALAERSPGFVWRLKSDQGNATDIKMSDPELIPNVSVWETVEDLERFVFGTIHVQFYNRRAEWFPRLSDPSFVMWDVSADHRPTIEEAEARLTHLTRFGPSDHAYGWGRMENLKLWMKKRCA